MDEVVEVEDGTDEVEGGVEGVGEVIGEGESAGGGAEFGAFFFGVLGWGEVFLLERVSGIVVRCDWMDGWGVLRWDCLLDDRETRGNRS